MTVVILGYRNQANKHCPHAFETSPTAIGEQLMVDIHPPQFDPLFQTTDGSLLAMWDEIQSLQADFAIAQELPFYYRSKIWRQARSVLDVGTGNGHYLALIAETFKGKHYNGIDKSRDFITIAKQRVNLQGVSFAITDVLGDFEDVTQSTMEMPWDFIIARLFFQHMVTRDLTSILQALGKVARPGAGLLIIDACDSARLFTPPVPKFMEFFRNYTSDQQKQGMERDVTALIEARVRLLPEWEIIERREICVPSTIPGNLERFSRSYALMIEIVERVGEVPVDATLKQAWGQWCEEEMRYTQVGLSILTLQRQ